MSSDYVFGYGSLVNVGTHDYADVRPAQLVGWRRKWRHVPGRRVAFLTVVTAQETTIDGVVAAVQSEAWPALDLREAGYLRAQDVAVSHSISNAASVSVYHAPDGMHEELPEPLPILMSYLDVITQGYARLSGPSAVEAFFATTDGWDAPILNDRANPIYPRHQTLSDDERALSDAAIKATGARIIDSF